MEDDLNTPGAIAALHDFASQIHKTTDPTELTALHSAIRRGGAILGILQQDPEHWFQAGSSMSAEDIDALINARNQARADKDFARADEIREQLLERGIELEDSRTGTTWRKKD